MSRHEELCPHCRARKGLDGAQGGELVPVVPPALPDRSTPLRVHTAGAPRFDCVLHPDGTLTAVIGGEVRRNFLSFADMCERNWADAHFELDPPPLADDPGPDPEPEIVPVQEALVA